MTNTTLTVAKLKKFHRSPAALAAIAAVKAARTEAARIHAHVESYQAPAFAKFAPFTRELCPNDPRSGERIMDRGDLFLASSEQDEQCAAWYAECDRLNAVHGYTLEPGYCPALVAEGVQRKAEQALLNLVGELTGIDGNSFNNTLELRAKTLDLFLNPPLK